MTPFDLLFLLVFVTTIGLLVAILLALARGRRDLARRRLRWLGIGAAAYFAVLVVVSLLAPQREVAVGEDQCSDDWCVAVTGGSRTLLTDSVRWRVTLRLSSRMARGSQRELGVVAYLQDSGGRRFDAVPEPDEAPFDTLLRPGQQVVTSRVFTVPHDSPGLGVIVTHAGWPPTPRCCIIAENESLLHKRAVVRLE